MIPSAELLLQMFSKSTRSITYIVSVLGLVLLSSMFLWHRTTGRAKQRFEQLMTGSPESQTKVRSIEIGDHEKPPRFIITDAKAVDYFTKRMNRSTKGYPLGRAFQCVLVFEDGLRCKAYGDADGKGQISLGFEPTHWNEPELRGVPLTLPIPEEVLAAVMWLAPDADPNQWPKDDL